MSENLENIVLNNNSQENETKYRHNNWLKDENHPILRKLEEKGGAIYLNFKGEISYRLSPNDLYTNTKDYKALSNIFSNFLEIDVDFTSFTKTKKMIDNDDIDENSLIKTEDLILVSGEIFNPHLNMEFIEQENGTYLVNRFKPSYYMQLDSNKIDLSYIDFEKTAIFLLILNLVNNDWYRAYWIINWLAYFFQGLKKSQVALVLVGIEGTGKGVFFENVIKPLFGEKYTKTINDKSLNTKYLGGLVEDVIFFFLDEISSQRSASDSARNFLKALVTNPSITAEKKNKTLENETPLYGQVLFATNEHDAIEIGINDRRHTVLSTGNTLINTGFLGLGSYETLEEKVKEELEQFAYYLKKYPVDINLANTALNTPEKDEMIHQYQMKQQVKISKQQKILEPRSIQRKLTKLERNIDEFTFHIKRKNISLFEPIKFENPELFQSIYNDIYNNVFRVENLLPVFKALYGVGSIKTNSEFLRELQKNDSRLFAMHNISSYLIGEEKKDCISLLEFFRRY